MVQQIPFRPSRPPLVLVVQPRATGGPGSQGRPDSHLQDRRRHQAAALPLRARWSAARQPISRHDTKIEDCIADARSAKRIASGGAPQESTFDSKNDDRSISAQPNAMVLFNPAMAVAPHEDLAATYNEQSTTRLSDRARGSIKTVALFHYAKEKQPPCIMFFGTDDPLLLRAEAHRKVSVAVGNQYNIITSRGQGRGFFNLTREAGNYYKLTVAEMDKSLVSLGWLKTRREKG